MVIVLTSFGDMILKSHDFVLSIFLTAKLQEMGANFKLNLPRCNLNVLDFTEYFLVFGTSYTGYIALTVAMAVAGGGGCCLSGLTGLRGSGASSISTLGGYFVVPTSGLPT